ncbi:MAG: hypothetical protein CMP91_07120 [Gammaproteobacteria bacterium]|nr:hypothetical protein [Gammaproteobacteria bacterium]
MQKYFQNSGQNKCIVYMFCGADREVLGLLEYVCQVNNRCPEGKRDNVFQQIEGQPGALEIDDVIINE